MPHRDRHHSEGAVRITSAPRSRADDIAARQKRYIFSMAVRTVCFLIVGAVFLPYVAVVMANAGPGRDNEAELRQVGGVGRELPTTPTPGPIGGTTPGRDA